MKKNKPVSEIMTRELICLELADTLTRAEALFKKNRIGHLPVLKEGNVVGILSLHDLLRIATADSVGENEEEIETTVYDMFTIEQVMTKKVVCVNPETPISEVAGLFLRHSFHSLPVVEEYQLVGIVTTTDVIRFFLEHD